MNQTTCLICSRSGNGWTILGKKIYNGLVNANTVFEHGVPTSMWIPKPFTVWTKENGFVPDTYMVTSIYLYHLMAPGEWCQIYWECEDNTVAVK